MLIFCDIMPDFNLELTTRNTTIVKHFCMDMLLDLCYHVEILPQQFGQWALHK